ncbi:MAG: choice-of-anchor D domain-containing protein [Thermoanaerobaculia bacterium]
MRHELRLASFLRTAAFAAACLLAGSAAHAQLVGGPDIDASQKSGDDNECAISKNPANPNQLFLSCNTTGPGLFAARSLDGGATWTYPDPADKTIADGDAGQGPAACCDPTSSWDSFGNLYLTYIDNSLTTIVTLLSTDGGATFSNLASFSSCVQCVDQPTVVAANTSAAGAPVAVWIVWNQNNQMVARGAAVTGLGTVGGFNPLQTIPGTAGCSFGDVAIAPSGAVVQACQNPTGGQGPATVFVNTDTDGLGAGNFGAAVAATTTNVGGFDFLPAQNARSVDAEAGLAFDDHAGSPHLGRLYLVYTEEAVNENNDMDVMLRFSDDNGGTWSAPIRANDDSAAPIRSQFLPKIAVDDITGNLSVCWHDCRSSASNTAMEVFCTVAAPTGASPAFLANERIGDASSTSNGAGVEFGDYSGLDYLNGAAHPVWADLSNSTGNNPDGTARFDAATDRVTGGPPAPQIQIPASVHLGETCHGGTGRGTLNVCNTGHADLTVDPITSSNPQFAVTSPSSGYPVVISHDFCFPFEVAFQPSATGAQTGTLTIASNDPAHASTAVQVFGDGTEPDIRVTGSTDFGVVSAWRPAEKSVAVCNTGACNLAVASATIDCGEFVLVNNPLPAAVSHDFCLDLVVKALPALPGRRHCEITIASDDPDTPSVTRTLIARTPAFLGLRAGLAEPHGALRNVARQGSAFSLDLLYPVRPRLAWDLRLGTSRLDGRAGHLDTRIWALTPEIRYTLNPASPVRVFLNGGAGAYHFDPGNFEGGGTLGLGFNVPAGPRFAIEATYDYHWVFTASPTLRFSQAQLGVLISF